MGFKVVYEDSPGGVHLRRVGSRKERRFHVLRWDDMDDCCGRDNEGHPRYCASLTEIDLDILTEKQRSSVLSSCGFETKEEYTDAHWAEMAVSYGLGAPLGQWSDNNLRRALRQARATSKELEQDPNAYEAAMNRTVNALGSTAREYGVGDLDSAMLRGIRKNEQNARIVGKMYGLDEETMKQIETMPEATVGMFRVRLRGASMPSDDPLAYAVGFIDAVSGKGKANAEGGELAPAYLEGYREGLGVKVDKKEWPTWIQRT